MNKNIRILILFVSLILIIYSLGLIHSLIYKDIITNLTSIDLDKTRFKDNNNSTLNVTDKHLKHEDNKTNYFEYNFDISELDSIKNLNEKNQNYYLMIEKPDCEYLEASLNGIIIGKVGQETGASNIWNGTYFLQFNENTLRQNNTLTLKLHSRYITGVSGDIKILPYDDYRKIELIIRYSFSIIQTASAIAFLIAIILALIIIAWHKQLYNINVYVYFLISLVTLGISLFDYREIQYLTMDYLMFKKLVILSYHITVSFTSLAVLNLLNAKFKFNIAFIGLILIIYNVIFTNNMIDFKNSYNLINYFLVAGIIHQIIYLIYYRKRALNTVLVLSIVFFFSGLTVAKLVYISSNSVKTTTLIDMPVLVVIYTSGVLFIFYNQLLQMVRGYEFSNLNNEIVGLTGSFMIDKTLTVRGAYSNSCDQIFKKLIVGESILDLLYKDDVKNNDKDINKKILEQIFVRTKKFKDAYLTLLTDEITLNECIYKVEYQRFERADIYLGVTLYDITKIKTLEKDLDDQNNLFEFILNSVKSKNELGYFIETTRAFFKKLKLEGFTSNNQKKLHTIKGNLGQFGFINFEKIVHEVETSLLDEYDTMTQVQLLEDGLNNSLSIVEEHIGENYLHDELDHYTISKNMLDDLENQYISTNSPDNEFLLKLKQLKYKDIGSMLSRYSNYINKLSIELNKEVHHFEATGDQVLVSQQKTEDFMMSIVSIFRNALIHGIEDPDKRIELDKDPTGQIKCTVKHEGEHIVIQISDDGAGIDIEKLKLMAIERGLIKSVDKDNILNQDILDLIFAEKLSSKDNVDILAGRGIGLSAVLLEVKLLKGEIKVNTELYKGTEYNISLPISSLVD